jgi:2-polyprenyl-3-methyl-5-hydroxy-6-metoxy-1,4-benzoquinol methylase
MKFTVMNVHFFRTLKVKLGRLSQKVMFLATPFLKLLYRFKHRINNSSSDFIGFDKYSYAGAYHWREIRSDCHYKQKADYILDNCSRSSIIIDFGCGDAAILGYLASSYINKNFIGIEADLKASKLAKKMLELNKIKNAHVITSSFGALEGGEEQADLAYSMDVIEHLPNPELLLEKMLFRLRPGGTVIVGTPLYINDELVSPYHVHEFELKELQDLASRYFEIIKTTLLPQRRSDNQVYSDNFCIVVGRKRPG